MKSRYVSESDAYVLLAIAITRQAAKDYRRELRKSKKTGVPTSELKRLEQWFTSDFGTLCTMGTGEAIIWNIKNGVPIVYHEGDDF